MKKPGLILILSVIIGSLSAQGKYGATPEDSIACITNISLYKEHFKQKNYIDAKTGWINVFDKCPQAQKSTYTSGVKMYTSFIKAQKNPELKQGLIDTLFMIYDRRIEYWGQEGYVLGRKGTKWVLYYPDDHMGAYEILKKSVYLSKGKSEAGALTTYYQVIYKAYDAGQLDKSVLVNEYIPVSEFVDKALLNNKSKMEAAGSEKEKGKYERKLEGYEKAKAIIDDIFIKVATCDDVVPIVDKRVKENPDNIEVLQKSLYVLSKRGCTDSEIFAEVAEKLHKLDPSAKSAHGIGMLMLKRKEYSEAAKYLAQAVEMCGDDCEADMEEYLLDAATAYYFEQKNKTAVSYARKALNINPNSGKALLIIGRAIAASASDCSSDEIERSAVYWLAVDYFYRAKAADSEIADQASSSISTYTKQFASKDKVFFAGLGEGDTYLVTCWNENTKVKIGNN
jgi:tetratricopeptide (TPR) repeat protein